LGYLDSYASQDEDRRPRLLRILFGAIGGMVLILGAIASNHERAYPARSDDKANAYVVSEKFVSRRLESPSTAAFCGYNEASVSPAGSDVWKVTCWAEDHNGAGEMRHRGFTSVVRKHGDLWSLERLTLSR
jgi:hypothetical protein